MTNILKQLEAKLAAGIKAHQVPAASVAVWYRGELHTAAAGILNLDTGVEATVDSCFQIGSITKVFTATLVMQLVDQGLIELDKPVKAYIPTFQVADPLATKTITVRQLLCHKSGIDGEFSAETDFGRDKLSRFVERCVLLPQIHPVGEYFSYCNAGFNIAGRLIEVVTGRTFEGAAEERLVTPLGMAHTAMLPAQTLRFRCAIGHVPAPPEDGKDAGFMISPMPFLESSGSPAGSFATMTAGDLLKFVRMHLNGGKAPDGSRVLSEESVRAMQVPQAAIPAPVSENMTGWGLGWSVMDWGRNQVLSHDGGTVGQNSYLRVIPSRNLAVCILTNGGDHAGLKQGLFSELFEALAGVSAPKGPAPVDLKTDNTPFIGRYENYSVYTEVFEKDGVLNVLFGTRHMLEGVFPEQTFQLKPITPTTFAICTQDGTVMDIGGAAFLSPAADGRTAHLFLGGRIYRRALI